MDIWVLYQLPVWATAVLVSATLLVAMEVGYRVGRRKYLATVECSPSEGGDVALASILALLGLVLAFTFSYTMSRFDSRKQAVLEEANAIGTAFLRAGLAPEPSRSQLRKILRDYAKTRDVTKVNVASSDAIRRVVERSLAAQSRLWPATETLVRSASTAGPVEVAIVQSINEVIDVHGKRLLAVTDRLPGEVFMLLVFIAGIAMFILGFHAGRQGSLSRWRLALLGFVLAAVITVITDFDRPATGLVRVNQQPIVDLIRDMDATLQKGSAK
jgi:hypothetical protein